MEKKYYLVLDQGTTSSRSILYDKNFNFLGKSSIKLTQSYPKANWVEHNPIEIWNAQRSTMQQVLIDNNVTIDEVISIGITNQRETIVVWDKSTGFPVYNAIVWQDNRCIDELENYKKYTDLIFEKTGLVLSPHFSAIKIKWILDNVPKAKELLKKNQLCIGTIDSWLLFKLSKHKLCLTDHTNASRTMLFNINTLTWDDELLSLFGIDKSCLCQIKKSADFYFEMENNVVDSNSNLKTPITGVCGDQQASLFGHGCFEQYSAKATFGTGCFLNINTGNKRVDFKGKLLTTINCTYDDKIQYGVESCIFNAGLVIEWLVNNLKILYIPEASDWYAQLSKTNINNDEPDLYFIPALTGLGAPYWNSNVSGSIIGINQSTKRENIIAAAIEGISYQVKDTTELLAKKDIFINLLNIDGGLSNINYLCEFTANVLHCTINKASNHEVTSLGACYLSALGANQICINDIQHKDYAKFSPTWDKTIVNKKYEGWVKNLKKLLNN